MIPVIIILKLTGEHYVFYKQARIGKDAVKFNIIKFSTMLLDSPNIGTGEISLKKDPRVFPFGRFLRNSKLNEIPQLINTLRGEMSVVGPRPLTPKHFNHYSPEQQKIVKQLKPGLTGVGAIIFRDEERIFDNSTLDHEKTYHQLLSPYKGALETWYFLNQSMWVDVKIIFLTIWVIPFKRSQLPYKILKGLPEKPAELKTLI
jgi:lipopolysaccharide/colanic/teichoic acid biosynthesis glycosyltransferase